MSGPTSAGQPRRRVLHAGRQRRQRAFERRLDEAPGIRLFENLRRELGVQGVPRAVRDEMTDDRVAHEREIADRVEILWRTNSSSNRAR